MELYDLKESVLLMKNRIQQSKLRQEQLENAVQNKTPNLSQANLDDDFKTSTPGERVFTISIKNAPDMYSFIRDV